MKYKTTFFIRNLNDELVPFGQTDVDKFVQAVNQHIEARCGFILKPTDSIAVKSASFDPKDGSITLNLTSNISNNYLVTSVFDVIPFCEETNKKVLAIFQGATGQKVTYDSDVATKA
jgi:hypothetical protein